LEVYGDLHQRTEEENILRGKVFKNGMDDSEITTLTDGSTDTVFSVWSEAELLIDLEQWHMIDELVFVSAQNKDGGYVIRASKDGENYKEISHGRIGKEMTEVDMRDYRGQFLKISLYGSFDLQEIKAYGTMVQQPDPGVN